MRSQRVFSAWILTAILVATTVGPAFLSEGQHYDPRQDLPQPTAFNKSMEKLGRGLANILLGWAEIPKTMYEKLEQDRPLGYLVGVAPVVGTTRALMRTGVGIFEVFTFPAPIGEANYDAVIEPEYIF